MTNKPDHKTHSSTYYMVTWYQREREFDDAIKQHKKFKATSIRFEDAQKAQIDANMFAAQKVGELAASGDRNTTVNVEECYVYSENINQMDKNTLAKMFAPERSYGEI